MATELRYWNLYITHPAERNGKEYNANRSLGVVAPTALDAIDLVLKAHPNATIWTVTHRGEVNLPLIEFKEYDSAHYRSDHLTTAAQPQGNTPV